MLKSNLPIGVQNMTLKSIDNLLLDGRTVENKGKLILTEIFPSVQKHDI